MITREALRNAIVDELDRQHDEGTPGPYVDAPHGSEILIDGHVDLDDLVDALIRAGVEVIPTK